ncbi:uncharacterized protein LOC101215299 isoform X2 [Cucumis sativus]|uniref:uncharacterized protein LOC101215299 isoform X2 n=1 Tax=Cucumis sativus TaxID=3659 RepID=UPI0002B4BB57|nr:uncharacterized protein LOC101215299 isoform X2 [Cucumis sativus]KAE8651639.1 hypothetical protein Csa_021182 [Cucumis sativus]
MEFKFRVDDLRKPPPPPPPPQMHFLPPMPPPMHFLPPASPAVYCLSEQGFPDFFMDSADAFRQTTNIGTLRQPFNLNEEMHLEMEFMRLREEKLIGEIERERFLKEEARRELRLFEREIAIRGLTQSAVGYPFQQPQRWVAPPFCPVTGPPSSAVAVPCPSPSQALVVQSYHEWQNMEQVKTSDRLGFGAVALRPRIQPLMVEDKKEAANERKLIEKPVPNAFREERKAETTTSPSIKHILPSLVKKTSKDEWSCALCQVTTAEEKSFNDHLRGKKHRRKEANLRAEKESKVSRVAHEPLSKKRRKLQKAMAAAAGGGAEGKETKDGEADVGEKSEGSVDMNALIPYFLKKENKQQQENNPTTNNDVMAKSSVKFSFWCEKCKVGAYVTKVMLAHVNGKQHQAKLKKANQTEEEERLL